MAKLVEMADELMEDAKRGERFEPPLDCRESLLRDRDRGRRSRYSPLRQGRRGAGRHRPRAGHGGLQQTQDRPTSPEPVRARLHSAIKRLLARHNDPPNATPEAFDLVLKQMERFANEWSTNGAGKS
ncbi:type I restriction enzyme endonuclease domain-containing protein [Streptomyces sp. NPDC047023]|uniref:type I restriction enzyme endonuclease domain-containing protein n=1 Tax=Streptomyces sp. NPDC047023 TaxID=3155139 RepID=UPI0033D74A8D